MGTGGSGWRRAVLRAQARLRLCAHHVLPSLEGQAAMRVRVRARMRLTGILKRIPCRSVLTRSRTWVVAATTRRPNH